MQFCYLITDYISHCRPSQQKPTAESLSAMLIQAIQSGDKQLLERVLNIQKDHLITGTVKNLSMNTIVPFLRTVRSLPVSLAELCCFSPSAYGATADTSCKESRANCLAESCTSLTHCLPYDSEKISNCTMLNETTCLPRSLTCSTHSVLCIRQ